MHSPPCPRSCGPAPAMQRGAGLQVDARRLWQAVMRPSSWPLRVTLTRAWFRCPRALRCGSPGARGRRACGAGRRLFYSLDEGRSAAAGPGFTSGQFDGRLQPPSLPPRPGAGAWSSRKCLVRPDDSRRRWSHRRRPAVGRPAPPRAASVSSSPSAGPRSRRRGSPATRGASFPRPFDRHPHRGRQSACPRSTGTGWGQASAATTAGTTTQDQRADGQGRSAFGTLFTPFALSA